MKRLDQIAQQISDKNQPPVHLWRPEISGDIDIRIDSLANWYHEGDPIVRDTLVALFSSILWAQEEEYYLVTPVEKWRIRVEDVPFVINQAEFADDAWVVTTNTHESVIVSESNPVELRQYQGQWVPYVCLRYELWARVNRSIYYQWVEAALEQQATPADTLTLHSQNYHFEVAKV